MTKKNGKGKEYDHNGNLIYEGEYLNGLRNGKGKEYNVNYKDKLAFEGIYYNGLKWEGKKYSENNEYIFQLKAGKGLIREYRYGKLSLECEYVNGLENGKYVHYYASGA